MSGVFAIARNIFDHEFFARENFTEREAWIWIIREAAWKDRRVRAGKSVVDLKRGQCAFSVRFMADAWGWSKSRVHRFLERLQSESMIGTDAGHGVMVLSVCNYDEYQRVSLPKKEDNGTQAGHERDSSGTNEKTGEILKINTPSGAEAPIPFIDMASPTEKQIFDYGKSVLGKSAGGQIVRLRKMWEFDDRAVADILRQASEKSEPLAWIAKVLMHTESPRTPDHILFPPEIYGVLR